MICETCEQVEADGICFLCERYTCADCNVNKDAPPEEFRANMCPSCKSQMDDEEKAPDDSTSLDDLEKSVSAAEAARQKRVDAINQMHIATQEMRDAEIAWIEALCQSWISATGLRPEESRIVRQTKGDQLLIWVEQKEPAIFRGRRWRNFVLGLLCGLGLGFALCMILN